MIGQNIGPYEIREPLGAGGMGEVYRAHDTKLKRDVAVKLLPASFLADEQRRGRFEREAQVLAALNHPHIGAIYGLEEAGGQQALILELIEGPTLAEMIEAGALPRKEALTIALQIAQALEAAHESGIIHRDLKPANVKVTPSGAVKVLDFGLAKAESSPTEASPGGRAAADSPTLSIAATQAGLILGTAGYMSPEQAKGRPADKRADIWSFGVVLFEMLSGAKAFAGESVSEVLAAVIMVEPDWSRLPADTPSPLLRLLRRCLRKDPRSRMRDIGDARIAIEELLGGQIDGEVDGVAGAMAPGGTTARAGGRRSVAVGTAAIVGAAVLGYLAALFLQPETASAPSATGATRFMLEPAPVERSLPLDPEISPDGTKVAYVDFGQLWVHDLDRLTPRSIASGEGIRRPIWSPDSEWLAFFADGRLWKLQLPDGEPIPIANTIEAFTGSAGGAWTPDGMIYFCTGNSPVYRVSDQGGEPAIVIPLADRENDFHQLSGLPGGRGVLLTVHARGRELGPLIAAGEGFRREFFRVPPGVTDRERWPIDPVYSPTGHVLFAQEGSGIWALPFDPDELAVSGPPFLVVAGGDQPSVANDGTLAYATGGLVFQLSVVDPGGVVIAAIGEPSLFVEAPVFSPDGQWIALASGDTFGEADIVLVEMATGARRKATFQPGSETGPTWSASGDRIAFIKRNSVYVAPIDGSTEPRQVVAGDAVQFTPDGEYLVYSSEGDIYYLPADLGGDPRLAVGGPEFDSRPRVSPDGRYVAFQRRLEEDFVYLAEFPGGTNARPLGTGRIPQWSADGSRLYYATREGRLLALSVSTSPGLRVGEPMPIFESRAGTVTNDLTNNGFAINPVDGRPIVSTAVFDQSMGRRLVVVRDWIREFATAGR